MSPLQGCLAACALVFASCGGQEPTASGDVGGAAATPAGSDVAPTLDRNARSNGGGFVLHWESAAELPPLNEEYGFAFRLTDADGAPLEVEPEDIVLDARMPHHGHGMNQDPTIESTGPGAFRVRGMRLHMTGHWEVYVDVRRGPVTERAEFVLELE